MDRVKWIEANGKRVLVADYSGLKALDEQLAVLDGQIKQEKGATGGLLGISNFTNTTASTELLERLKQTSSDGIVSEKTAVLGIDGVKAILLQGYIRVTGRKNIKACKTEEEAIAFVTS